MLCRFDYPPIWKTLEEQLLYNAEYESLRDILDVLEAIKEPEHFHNENFWQRMMEKIIKMK